MVADYTISDIKEALEIYCNVLLLGEPTVAYSVAAKINVSIQDLPSTNAWTADICKLATLMIVVEDILTSKDDGISYTTDVGTVLRGAFPHLESEPTVELLGYNTSEVLHGLDKPSLFSSIGDILNKNVPNLDDLINRDDDIIESFIINKNLLKFTAGLQHLLSTDDLKFEVLKHRNYVFTAIFKILGLKDQGAGYMLDLENGFAHNDIKNYCAKHGISDLNSLERIESLTTYILGTSGTEAFLSEIVNDFLGEKKVITRYDGETLKEIVNEPQYHGLIMLDSLINAKKNLESFKLNNTISAEAMVERDNKMSPKVAIIDQMIALIESSLSSHRIVIAYKSIV